MLVQTCYISPSYNESSLSIVLASRVRSGTVWRPRAERRRVVRHYIGLGGLTDVFVFTCRSQIYYIFKCEGRTTPPFGMGRVFFQGLVWGEGDWLTFCQ